MSRVLQSGFELQDVSKEFPQIVTDGSATFTIVTSAARSGNASLRINTAATNNRCYGIKSLPAATGELYIRMAIKLASFTTSSNNCVLFGLNDGATRHITVGINSSQQIYIARLGTVLTQTPSIVPTNIWTLVEFHFTIADSGGVIQVRFNANTVLDLDTTGDTRNSGAATVDSITIGEDETFSGTSHHSYDIYLDDLAINTTAGSVNNSWCGNGGIILLVPNGAGDTTQLSRGGTDSGNNYGQVDDVPNNGTTDYVYASSAGSADLYTLTDTSLPSASGVKAIRWMAVARENIAGAGSISRYIKTNSVAYEGGTFGLTTSDYSLISEIIENNPNTSTAFTIAELDALQAGVMTR